MRKAEPKTDEAIVAQIIAGDIDAFEEIMTRYEDKLTRYVIYLIRHQTTVEDVVQETFIKAYQNLHNFNPKYKFSSWIYRIAHNEAINAVRKLRFVSDKEIDDLPDVYDQKVGEIIDQKLRQKQVRLCLNQLSQKYREVVQLVYLENMKYEEVGQILQIPTSTVGVRLARAKNQLKKICEQKGVKL